MRAVVDLAPPHSVVLVMDQSIGIVPAAMDGGLVAATPSCVAVGTFSEHDGTTRITLTDEASRDMSGASNLVFDGFIETPSRLVAVCSILDDAILKLPVDSQLTRVQVWANHSSEPSEICVCVGPAEAAEARR